MNVKEGNEVFGTSVGVRRGEKGFFHIIIGEMLGNEVCASSFLLMDYCYGK